MTRAITNFLLFIFISIIGITASSNDIVIHSSGGKGGHDQSSYPPPEASYDDETSTLTVYFNMGGTLTLTCTDTATGATSTVVYQQAYSTGSTATVVCTTPGYYEITVNCSYAGTYTGHFTVY